MPSETAHSYSCAGKVFLLGEYAALSGLPSLVAAVGPRFGLRVGGTSAFASESPVGRLLAWAGEPALSFSFEDPHDGAGGFGASTAEFALAYLALAETRGWDDSRRRWDACWSLYRELTGMRPSGADLVAQWRGGVTLFDGRERRASDLFPLFDWSGTLVFSAAHQPGRKLATHEHLATLPSFDPASLEPLVAAGVRAVGEGAVESFGRALTAYAEALSSEGLETPAARADRLALSGLPGVLGCKGAGAGLNDAIVVQLVPRSPARAAVVAAAEARGLHLVADGLSPELGVHRCL
jgi:mevalonate kinase